MDNLRSAVGNAIMKSYLSYRKIKLIHRVLLAIAKTVALEKHSGKRRLLPFLSLELDREVCDRVCNTKTMSANQNKVIITRSQ